MLPRPRRIARLTPRVARPRVRADLAYGGAAPRPRPRPRPRRPRAPVMHMCALRHARSALLTHGMRARWQVWFRDDWYYSAMTLCLYVSFPTGAPLVTTSRARSPAHLARARRASAEADMMPFSTASRRARRRARVDKPRRLVRHAGCAADPPPAPRPRELPRLAAPPKGRPPQPSLPAAISKRTLSTTPPAGATLCVRAPRGRSPLP